MKGRHNSSPAHIGSSGDIGAQTKGRNEQRDVSEPWPPLVLVMSRTSRLFEFSFITSPMHPLPSLSFTTMVNMPAAAAAAAEHL